MEPDIGFIGACHRVDACGMATDDARSTFHQPGTDQGLRKIDIFDR
jgi:hypothetical protein